jgi:ketosteroid isomerase-like protein
LDDARFLEQRVRDFGDAWNCGDIDALMSMVADDCVFSASVGPEPGATFVGKTAVREGFMRMLEHDAHATPEPGDVHAFGTLVVATWGLSTPHQGRCITVRGIDLFEFRQGMIIRKDAFRKTFD